MQRNNAKVELHYPKGQKEAEQAGVNIIPEKESVPSFFSVAAKAPANSLLFQNASPRLTGRIK